MRWAACLGLAACLNGVVAQTTSATQPEADVPGLRPWLSSIEARFRPPPAGVLDDELQQAAVEFSALALRRIAFQAPSWLAEMRQRLGPARPADELLGLLHQRLQHEEALWQLQPLSPELVEAWIAAATQPRFCIVGDGPSWYSRRVARWSLVPKAARPALLASERAAIARLGEALPAPARPVPGAIEAANEAMARVRQQGPRPRVPMTPILALRVLAKALPPEQLTLLDRCAMNQWWLRERLAHAAPDDAAARAAAWDAFRFDWIPNLQDFFGQRPPAIEADKTAADSAYPRLARQQEITGTVTVAVSVDDRGQVLRARVVERELRAPGVPGRPVAYETALDEAALAQVRDPARVKLAPGKPERRIALAFTLD
jgi:TonB family protein